VQDCTPKVLTFMETELTISTEHPTEDVLEELVFQRLPAHETLRLIEHLLHCEGCREAFQDTLEFVILAKQALRTLQRRELPALKVRQLLYG